MALDLSFANPYKTLLMAMFEAIAMPVMEDYFLD